VAQRDQYFLGQSLAEQERLRRQAEELAKDSNFLFDRIAIAPGSRIVELGCGPRGCFDILSRRVGCQGSVVGIEIDPEAAARARQYLADQNIENVEVRQGDGKATGLPRESFDVATARLVLLNIREPERIVAEMVALVKRGGVVALHEADWGFAYVIHRLPLSTACYRYSWITQPRMEWIFLLERDFPECFELPGF